MSEMGIVAIIATLAGYTVGFILGVILGRRQYEGGNSKTRNPRIQTMLRMIGYGDNAGSGFPTILDAWRGGKWREPDLYEDAELQQVELKLFTIAMMPEECTAYLSELLGAVMYQKLSSEEQIILGTAHLEGSVSNQRLQQMLDLHPTDIGRILSGLVDKGMLVSKPKGRWTTYAINKEYQQTPEQICLSDIEVPGVQLNATDRAIINISRPMRLYQQLSQLGQQLYERLSQLGQQLYERLLENKSI